MIAFSCRFEERAILPAKAPKIETECWLWGVQESKCEKIYITGHRKSSPFQLRWSVRGAIPTFDVSWCKIDVSLVPAPAGPRGNGKLRLKSSERVYTVWRLSWNFPLLTFTVTQPMIRENVAAFGWTTNYAQHRIFSWFKPGIEWTFASVFTLINLFYCNGEHMYDLLSVQ